MGFGRKEGIVTTTPEESHGDIQGGLFRERLAEFRGESLDVLDICLSSFRKVHAFLQYNMNGTEIKARLDSAGSKAKTCGHGGAN